MTQLNQSNPLSKSRMEKFLSYYKPYKRIFAIDMLFAVISSFAALLFPLVSGFVTKEVLGQWSESTLKMLFLAGTAMAALVFVRGVANIIYSYQGHSMGAKMEGDMRRDLFAHYQAMSFDFFAHNGVGRLMTLLSNDLTNMTELFHHGPEDILMTAIKFIGAFVILSQINLPLTLVVFSVFPILCLIALYTDKKMQSALLLSKARLTDMNEQLEDTLAGIRTVKAFGNENSEELKFHHKNKSYVQSRSHFYRVESYFYETIGAYPQFLTMLVVIFGAWFMRDAVDVSVLVTFLLYISCLYEPVQIMINFMSLYENGKASFVRFMEMLEKKPTITEKENAKKIENVKGEITFDKVAFGYPGSTGNVLEELSLCIGAGENIAIVGSSGIGKSTLSSLIARFYDVTGGSICIDDVDIRDITLASLRENIGIVQQEVYIFAGTIKENICYGTKIASDEEIIEAATLACAHEFICQMASGYDTILGTRGITLSGGQRQRISLARVFLKNPAILILDEATSALDNESELIVQSALTKLMVNRTSIVIAHRLSTILGADRIIVLKDRTIVECGTHDALIGQNGEYDRLYQMSVL